MGKHTLYDTGFGQRVDGAGHVEQSREQDAEPDRDSADRLRILKLAAHNDHHTDDQSDRRKCGRLQEPQP